jgi:hypothetical protein
MLKQEASIKVKEVPTVVVTEMRLQMYLVTSKSAICKEAYTTSKIN